MITPKVRGLMSKLKDGEVTTGTISKEWNISYTRLSTALTHGPHTPKPVAIYGKIRVYKQRQLEAWLLRIGEGDRQKGLRQINVICNKVAHANKLAKMDAYIESTDITSKFNKAAFNFLKTPLIGKTK